MVSLCVVCACVFFLFWGGGRGDPKLLSWSPGHDHDDLGTLEIWNALKCLPSAIDPPSTPWPPWTLASHPSSASMDLLWPFPPHPPLPLLMSMPPTFPSSSLKWVPLPWGPWALSLHQPSFLTPATISCSLPRSPLSFSLILPPMTHMPSTFDLKDDLFVDLHLATYCKPYSHVGSTWKLDYLPHTSNQQDYPSCHHHQPFWFWLPPPLPLVSTTPRPIIIVEDIPCLYYWVHYHCCGHWLLPWPLWLQEDQVRLRAFDPNPLVAMMFLGVAC